MCIKVEASQAEGLAQKVGEAVRDITKLRAEVELVAEGNLPNDGKVIEDARTYQ
jgi:phenylacetate-CoA ligase